MLPKDQIDATSGSVFADRIERVKMTIFELEVIKIVDCSLNGHGNYTNGLVTFKIKSLKTNHFLKSKEICINQVVLHMI